MTISMKNMASAAICAAALALTGCTASADLDAAPNSSSTNEVVAPGAAVHSLKAKPGSTAAPCPEPQNTQAVCATVQNSAMTFTAPNVLTAAALPLFMSADVCDPSALAGGVNQLNCPGGLLGQYQAPAPLPKSETITMEAFNNTNDGTSFPTAATCNNSQYLLCSVTAANQNDPMSVSYLVTNLPITVQVTNNLSSANNDTLTMQGQPQAYQMLIDPAGGNPTTIAPGSSGYFGLYGSTGTVNTDPESFYVQYQIGSGSNDLAGARFLINVIIDQATGTLTKQAGCSFMPGATSQSGNTYCDLTLQGTAGGPQTVIVDIHQ